MPKAAIIIRTKNEERWLGRCLAMLRQQNEQDFEIILVDNQSTDGTVAIAKRAGITKIISIADYYPGKSLNLGIAQSEAPYIVCLSAHCLPKNAEWLTHLLAGFATSDIAGVYGRQIPVQFSSPSDKRDLLITFGRDRRIQVLDYFFHNANSAIRREVWQQLPFDELTTNIEDRLWARAVIGHGYKILYEPAAVVYHHHGIHQNNDLHRVRNVVSIIEHHEGDEANGLPEILHPSSCHVAAVLPLMGAPKTVAGRQLLSDLLGEMCQSQYISTIAVITDDPDAAQQAQQHQAIVIGRPPHFAEESTTIDDVMQYALLQLEERGEFPDVVVYANYLYPFRPQGLFDGLITQLQSLGLDSVFPVFADYNNYWWHSPEGKLVEVGDALKARAHKEPLQRAIYGLGCATATPVIRAGRLVGERAGLFPLTDSIYGLKCDGSRSEKIISLLLEKAEVPLVN